MRRLCLLAAVALAAGCGSVAHTAGRTPDTAAGSAATPGAHGKEPDAPDLTPAQRRFIAAVRKAGAFDADDTERGLIQAGTDFCGSDNADNLYTDFGGNPPNVEGLARNRQHLGALEKNAVRYLCPRYIKTWKQAMGGFDVGDHQVGAGIKPGRYRTLDKGLKGCYWERVSKSGQTLANDFVSYAPGHIEVTILPGDGGFSSSRKCSFWVPANLD